MDQLVTDYRQAMRRLTSAVSVISTAHGGTRHGITVTSVTSVSMAPPSLLICVNQRASIHAPLIRSGRFCVNILHAHQTDVANAFSGGVAGDERFLCAQWSEDDEETPHLVEAQASIFCEMDAISSYGTHSIIVGRVRQVGVRGQVAPLLYQDGRYTVGLSEQIDWVLPIG